MTTIHSSHAESIFWVIPIIVCGGFAFALAKGISEWSANNGKPVLSEQATIVAKRLKASGGSNGGNASTWYYVTFDVPSRERQEFRVSGREYGQLSEEDEGVLVSQGTRYHRFVRSRVPRTADPHARLQRASQKKGRIT